MPVGADRLAADACARTALDGNEAVAHRVVISVHGVSRQLGECGAQVILVGVQRGFDAADLSVFIDKQVSAVDRKRKRRVEPQAHLRHRRSDGARQQGEGEGNATGQKTKHLVNVR